MALRAENPSVQVVGEGLNPLGFIFSFETIQQPSGSAPGLFKVCPQVILAAVWECLRWVKGTPCFRSLTACNVSNACVLSTYVPLLCAGIRILLLNS